MTTRPIRFLSAEDVLRMHQLAIVDQGGDQTIRDRGLLESALAMARQQFAGEYLHADVPAMAGAYAFTSRGTIPSLTGTSVRRPRR